MSIFWRVVIYVEGFNAFIVTMPTLITVKTLNSVKTNHLDKWFQ